MKTLILKSDKDSFEKFFLENMQTDKVDTYSIYKDRTGMLYYISVVFMKYLQLPFESIWYNIWKKKLNDYDTIIVFDRVLSYKVLNYIHFHNKRCRIIFWYWNTIDHKKNKLINNKYREFCEIWSFDDMDCKKYNFKHNIQFYFLQSKKSFKDQKYDAIFVGYDKGRFETVRSINDKLSILGYKTFIKVIKDDTSIDTEDKIYCENSIPYTDILKLLTQTKCIIDVPQSGQTGITMRVLESLFYGLKLFTTDTGINKYDFYCNKNIFVWDENNMHNLNSFMSHPYVDNNNSTLINNSFEKWLDNFNSKLEV